MSMIDWYIEGSEFGNCNCSFGCPCQFEALQVPFLQVPFPCRPNGCWRYVSPVMIGRETRCQVQQV